MILRGKLRTVESEDYNGKTYHKVTVEEQSNGKIWLTKCSIGSDRVEDYRKNIEKDVEINVAVVAKVSKNGKPYLNIWEVQKF